MSKKRISTLLFLFLLVMVAGFLVPRNALANNLSITSFSDYSTDSSADTVTFTLNVSWSNSWRNATNYDAVWLFLRYSTDGGKTWSPAYLSASGTNPTGFNTPSGFTIVVPTDKIGLFLYRSTVGSGTSTASSVRVVWDYAQAGLTDAQAAAGNTTLKVFGIEMVYIPQGGFFAGDGQADKAAFVQGSADTRPWYIGSESAIRVQPVTNDGYYYMTGTNSGEGATGSSFVIPAGFPKGYQAFYSMKYEMTEGEWVSFFNTLTTTARTVRDITSNDVGGKNSDATVNRNTISWATASPCNDYHCKATTLRTDRAMNYPSWPDLLAFCDWSGLRPMTELEFEKSARGADVTAVPGEYAWGTSSSGDVFNSVIITGANGEDGTETVTDSYTGTSANVVYNMTTGSFILGDGGVGPLRVGINAFATSTRIQSGASYYGVMELSGNVYERAVTVGNATGRAFQGTHGDGVLSSTGTYYGNATNTDWPGINATSARGVTDALGSGYRGGAMNATSLDRITISYRISAANNVAVRVSTQGGRCVRTAP